MTDIMESKVWYSIRGNTSIISDAKAKILEEFKRVEDELNYIGTCHGRSEAVTHLGVEYRLFYSVIYDDKLELHLEYTDYSEPSGHITYRKKLSDVDIVVLGKAVGLVESLLSDIDDKTKTLVNGIKSVGCNHEG